MSIMSICKLEKSTWNSKDVSLRQQCRNLTSEDLFSDWIKLLLVDLFETLYSTPSGVGLAAPQVGLQLKIAVIDIKRDTKNPLVLINPSYIGIGEEMRSSTESCLSVPGVVGRVLRFERICVKYTNLNGELIEKECTGFEATVMQHEIDHLYGIVYIDKLTEGTSTELSESHIHRQATKSVNNSYQKAERNLHE